MNHGEYRTYVSGCRCDECREANRVYKCDWQRKNRTKARASSKRWETNHRKRRNEVKKRYCDKNRERIREQNLKAKRKWATNNPEKARADNHRSSNTRRAREHNAFIEQVERDTVYEMHGGMCGICEQFIDKNAPEALERIAKGEAWFHVDHVIPLSKEGLHCYANVQPAHPSCNRRKSNKC